jgi:cytochrome c oxidase subunit 2
MKKLTILTTVTLIIIGSAVWYVRKEPPKEAQNEVLSTATPAPAPAPAPEVEALAVEPSVEKEELEFPKVTTEEVNGRTERTIHMGVRQWAWEPNVIRAKQGELVRLIIHNADVNHPLYIPELGIEAEVPPEGAVVEFEAKKKGSFFFLCGTYCGEGHAEMQGTLVIE